MKFLNEESQAIQCDIKAVETSNAKGSARQEDESSPYPACSLDLTATTFVFLGP